MNAGPKWRKLRSRPSSITSRSGYAGAASGRALRIPETCTRVACGRSHAPISFPYSDQVPIHASQNRIGSSDRDTKLADNLPNSCTPCYDTHKRVSRRDAQELPHPSMRDKTSLQSEIRHLGRWSRDLELGDKRDTMEPPRSNTRSWTDSSEPG